MGEVLLIVMALFTAFGQILIRKGAIRLVKGFGIKKLIISFINIYLAAGFFLALAAPVFYITALKFMSLSRAFMFNSLSYLLVTGAGRFILKERANIYHYLGLSLITLGFLLPVLSGNAL